MKSKRVKKGQTKCYRAKVVMVGDSGVGKTSILLRYDGQGFTSCLSQTLGASFISSTIRCIDSNVELNIWDTAGQERFRSMAPLYLRNATAAILVYDITRYETFRNLESWVTELERHAPLDVTKFVMANKSDLEECRVISTEEGREFAERIYATYFETSAMSGRGIESGIKSVAEELLKKANEKEGEPGVKVGADPPIVDADKKEHRFCCNII
ncbi:unnamed protein product [Bursaphelenchus xylophilus]|uniref:(pine wood nematode) hypothetical protein n=1 Tax=Bursaphelenchus xylophilus TaxID=6326 RepID=A0A1I7RKW8_BURXY|nr:unnamed protein product [Bursaphelenchus xylophilus]CAG9083774.1 unnamed protein product [Bursaphelenchus xylophilus]